MASFPLDLDALRAKYAEERDKRIATDDSQRRYRDVEQGFAHLLEDAADVQPGDAGAEDREPADREHGDGEARKTRRG